MKFLPMKLLKKNKSITPAGKNPIRSSLCFFPAGQPRTKGGEWRTSTKITSKLHNNMNVDPMNQARRVGGQITYIKGTREGYLKIKSEYSKSFGHFWQKFLTKNLRKEKEMTLRKISAFDVERVKDPIDELADTNDVAILKAKIIEFQNALNGKNRVLHSKKNEVLELKETVMFLRGEVRYCFEEINRLDAFRASQDIRIPKSSHNNFNQNQDGA
jgi:hypothetical protein